MEVVPMKSVPNDHSDEEEDPVPRIYPALMTQPSTSLGYGYSTAHTETKESGYAAQIVRVFENHIYLLEEQELARILMREEIKNLPVVVVSVAGAYRRGKSFLLNWFLRYLTSPLTAQKDGSWLSEDSEPLAGFSWCSGTKRNTTGILLWSEPVLMVLPSGEKVAVLLMDTQGTFDSESTVRDCSTIFALSTLLSSVQIYNLSNNIQEDDLQHLQLFTEYGRLVRDKQKSKAFQVLEFLVRDWQFDDYAYGAAGGRLLLEDKLMVTPGMPQEMKNLRSHINSCFEKVSCFLMPHPGFKVTKKQFDGNISDIEPDFRHHLAELVSSIFGPQKLMPKKINGELVRARDLCTYFRSYVAFFNSDRIPSTKTIMEATVQAGMLAAVDEARAVYESGMEATCGVKQPSVPAYDLKQLHENHVAKACQAFTNKKKMGSSNESKAYREKLSEELKERLPLYQQSNMAKTQEAINRAKDAYEQQLAVISDGRMLCVHPNDLLQIHQQGFRAARNIFDTSRKYLSMKKDKEREAFLESFEKRYSLLQLANDQNNHMISVQLRMEYYDTMQMKTNVEPPLSEAELLREHEAALHRVLDDFEAKRNRTNHHTHDRYKYNLTQDILKSFDNLKAMNQSMNKIAIQASVTVYNQYMDAAWDHNSMCLHSRDLEDEHAVGRSRALLAFRPNRAVPEADDDDDDDDDDGFDTCDSDEQTLRDIINQRFDDLKKINVSANETAVQEAYNLYCSTMDDLCRPTLWWLLIIPIIVHLASKSSYNDTATEKAIKKFQSNRRETRTLARDLYLENLKEKMERAYNNY